FRYASVTNPDTAQLTAMFSLSGSTSPTAATLCEAIALGGCEGGTVGRRTGREPSVQATANVKLIAATNGRMNRFMKALLFRHTALGPASLAQRFVARGRPRFRRSEFCRHPCARSCRRTRTRDCRGSPQSPPGRAARRLRKATPSRCARSPRRAPTWAHHTPPALACEPKPAPALLFVVARPKAGQGEMTRGLPSPTAPAGAWPRPRRQSDSSPLPTRGLRRSRPP